VYLRDELEIVTWKQGHGNQYSATKIANVYRFDYNAMRAISKSGSPASELSTKSAESDSPSAESDLKSAESDLERAEFDSRTLTTQYITTQDIQLLKNTTPDSPNRLRKNGLRYLDSLQSQRFCDSEGFWLHRLVSRGFIFGPASTHCAFSLRRLNRQIPHTD
jgi:hypothetical protein